MLKKASTALLLGLSGLGLFLALHDTRTHQSTSKLTPVVTQNESTTPVVVKADTLPSLSDVAPISNVKSERKIVTGPKVQLRKSTYIKEQRTRLKEIGSHPTDQQIKDIYAFLETGPNNVNTLAIKDQYLTLLENQATDSSHVDKFIALALRQELHGDFRGYVVQHLRSAYPLADEAIREKIKDCFYKGLADKHNDVSGTALLALCHLSLDYADFDRNLIRQAAWHLARNEDVHLPTRISAMQMCGQTRIKEALPLARDICRGKGDYALRLAALATIGDLGDQEDLPMLQDMSTLTKYKTVRMAAQRSLHLIQKRYGIL